MEEIKSEITRLQTELKAKSQDMFREGVEEIFNKYPELESFAWRQYTPYFNDGENCYFGVHVSTWGDNNVDGISINGSSFWWPQAGQPLSEELTQAAVETAKLINTFDENVLMDIFGDHVTVTVHKDRVETEYYDHE